MAGLIARPGAPRIAALVTLSLLVALLVAACGGPNAATPTPGGMSEVLPALALRGATIERTVGGDAGCPDSPLRSNAARIELTLADDSTTHVVYLFRWRRPAQFDEAAQPFADCVEAFGATVEGEVPIATVEVAPWRAYGAGWSEDLLIVLEQALRDVGGG